jgi:hypothetical protein
MENNSENLNRYQIIRKDARNCFVETKSDYFLFDKVHLEFAKYDATRPSGERQTDHVHIYINVPEFLLLAHEALSGALHMRARQERTTDEKERRPLYRQLGGTSAERLAKYGRTRPDGKSLSRTVKLQLGKTPDTYLFSADSGPGETNATGLIVPKFGGNPENHVSVPMDWRNLNELLLTTKTHYEAWLAAWYVKILDVRPSTSAESRP